ncbi:hypothetical protein HPMBJEAJ_00244 [Aeromonas phage avDM6]|nr:hypothetical protein HPMBJEAJ_00244 [Aeromonas phage avDM6]
MLIESLSVLAVSVGIAYGLDKFMGTGFFKWKETPKDNLIISKEDQDRKLKNDHNLGEIIHKQKVKNKNYYGGGYKAKVVNHKFNVSKPHPVIINFVNKLYKENQK